jgi:dephospho-CoA kinase
LTAAPVRPLRVALTGGIATGKSYCLARFATLGAPTIDADLLSRQAVAPGTAGFDAIRSRFGAAVMTADGRLDREALGRIVFADADARHALEAIVHPAVYAAVRRWFETLGRSGQAPIGIADVPLLYETGHDGEFDAVIVASCPPGQQLERLMARSGLPREDAARRVAAQWPMAEKARRAHYVIDTSGSFGQTDDQIREVWARLRDRSRRVTTVTTGEDG